MRVSSLPLFLRCPSSQAPCDREYNPPSDAADLGRAVHEALADAVLCRDVDLDAVAKRYGCDRSELGWLYGYGLEAWMEVRDAFPQPRVEERLTADRMRGTADVFSISDDRMAVLDWKTSRQRTDFRPQLLGYANCAWTMYGWPASKCIDVYTVWLRLGEIDHETVTQKTLLDFHSDLDWSYRGIGKQYAPGEACTYCRCQLQCEARQDYMRCAAATMQQVDAGAVLAPDQLASLYPLAQALGKALDQYKDALRMVVKLEGEVAMSTGDRITLKEENRDEIDAREAWPILVQEGFSDDDIAGCVRMSSKSVLDVAGKRAGRGMKGKAKAALKQLLRDRGAVTTKTIQKLAVVKGTKR